MVCGTMADLREDPGTVRHLARLGRSVVTSDQALAISSQVGAVSYVETAAQLSVDETFQLFSMASLAALEARRQTYHQLVEAGPRPASVNSNSKFSSATRNIPSRSSHSSLNTGQEREAATVSVPTSPSKASSDLPVHSRYSTLHYIITVQYSTVYYIITVH